MRHRIEHRSTYHYDGRVTASFNEVRLTPAARPWQYPIEFAITADTATWQYTYWDYWGTEVRVVEVQEPHTSLQVVSSSIVEVLAGRRPVPAEPCGWDALAGGAVRERFAEFLATTTTTRPPDELAETVRDLASGHDPAGTAAALSQRIHEAMTYQPGATQVHTEAADAWRERSGVCQDYAHLAVGALRTAGIPARYVSGYLHPEPEPVVGASAVGESHAWIEYWCGEWVALDPTNDTPVAERHVTVANARQYADVAPIKGIVAGRSATTRLDVEVNITRME